MPAPISNPTFSTSHFPQKYAPVPNGTTPSDFATSQTQKTTIQSSSNADSADNQPSAAQIEELKAYLERMPELINKISQLAERVSQLAEKVSQLVDSVDRLVETASPLPERTPAFNDIHPQKTLSGSHRETNTECAKEAMNQKAQKQIEKNVGELRERTDDLLDSQTEMLRRTRERGKRQETEFSGLNNRVMRLEGERAAHLQTQEQIEKHERDLRKVGDRVNCLEGEAKANNWKGQEKFHGLANTVADLLKADRERVASAERSDRELKELWKMFLRMKTHTEKNADEMIEFRKETKGWLDAVSEVIASDKVSLSEKIEGLRTIVFAFDAQQSAFIKDHALFRQALEKTGLSDLKDRGIISIEGSGKKRPAPGPQEMSGRRSRKVSRNDRDGSGVWGNSVEHPLERLGAEPGQERRVYNMGQKKGYPNSKERGSAAIDRLNIYKTPTHPKVAPIQIPRAEPTPGNQMNSSRPLTPADEYRNYSDALVLTNFFEERGMATGGGYTNESRTSKEKNQKRDSGVSITSVASAVQNRFSEQAPKHAAIGETWKEQEEEIEQKEESEEGNTTLVDDALKNFEDVFLGDTSHALPPRQDQGAQSKRNSIIQGVSGIATSVASFLGGKSSANIDKNVDVLAVAEVQREVSPNLSRRFSV